jgi:cell division protein FtsI/penicillin-binding protein 2
MARRRSKLDGELLLPKQLRRLLYLTVLLIGGFGWLGYTLVQVQVIDHEKLTEAAKNNTERTYMRQPQRGDIRDARGNVMATSKIVETVCADPTIVGTNYNLIARQLAPLLGADQEELSERIRPRNYVDKTGKVRPLVYVILKRRVEVEDWEKIKKTMEHLDFGVDEKSLLSRQRSAYGRIRSSAVFSEPDQIRFYPNGSLGAHVLGYVGLKDRETPKGPVVEIAGQDGLELTLNQVLTGVEGWRQTETDSRKRELVPFRDADVAPRAGLNVALTIDMGIQHIVETELAAAFEKHTPVSISSIVMRPKTGEILAMANLPNFNPNAPGDVPQENLRNRTITDIAEPGSTFKVVVISGALNDGAVNLWDSFDTENGVFRFAGTVLHDHAGERYNVLTVEGIISKSSNIGAAKIGIRLGPERVYHYVRDFGFGQYTGIPLPGERMGIAIPVQKWNKVSISRIPMGHEVAVTPLQMVMAMGAIANKGILMKPMLVDKFVDESGQTVAKFQPQPIRRVISEAAAAKMVTALKTVISTNGTGAKAKLNYYTAAGKTGTAQKIVNGHYSHDKHYSSFIGFLPADDPELCISVVLDEPKKGSYGGETAAPVFARIAERAANYMAIPPDLSPAVSTQLSGQALALTARPARN